MFARPFETFTARLATEVDLRKPVCEGSGRCCHFEAFGHRLYVTTMELAVFSDELAEVEVESTTPGLLPVLNSISAGDCVFQVGKACGVHRIRPFGCRMFYCDPTADDWQKQMYETFHGELKRLHEKLGVAYFYVEWRGAVQALRLTARKIEK